MGSIDEVELVQATPDESSTIKKYVEAYVSFDHLMCSPEVLSAVEELLRNPAWGVYFLIRANAVNVGYVALTYGFDAEACGRIGVITDFYLDETARGRGVGRLAMEALLNFSRTAGLNQIDLVVIEGNNRAEHLYNSLGFTRTRGRFWMSLGL